MKNKNIVTWLVLVLMTIISTFFAGGKYALYSILLLAVIKILMVGSQFMELKKAHPFWIFTLAFINFIVVFVIIIQFN